MAIMNRILINRLINRNPAIVGTIYNQIFTSCKLLDSTSSSSDSDSSDDEEKLRIKKKFEKKYGRNDVSKKETLDLLNSLLTKMSEDQLISKSIDIAVPKRPPPPEKPHQPTLEEKIMSAAKEVAASVGGQVEKIEGELLDKVFSTGSKASTGKLNMDDLKSPTTSLSDLLANMKIDRRPTKDSSSNLSSSKSTDMKELVQKFQRSRGSMKSFKSTEESLTSSSLFTGQPLNVFVEKGPKLTNTPKVQVWDLLEERELQLLVTHPPENIFQEMIQWTEKGILWKFPINNEIDMAEEENIHFSEHVFMERHLKDWCPRKGPIRHFMELVCVGLSKNPYLTVKEKKDHIMWYRDYFADKQALLKEIGAIDKDISPSSNQDKQISP